MPAETNASPDATPALSPANQNRLIALIVLIPCLAVLSLAAWLEPDPAGVGTHEKLGLPACGFKTVTSLPCMSCGMTTAFSHAADGELITAFSVQPAGTVLAIGMAILVWVAGYAAVTGLSLVGLGRTLASPRTIVALLAVVIIAWAYTLALHMGS